MKQLACTIAVSNEALADVIVAELSAIGFDGFEVKEDSLLAYIPEDQFKREDCEVIFSKYTALGDATLTGTELIEPVNWNEIWEKSFDPVVIADRLLIRAPFHSVEKSYEHEIVIEPKMAFGTGHHETTFMVLEAMLDMDFAGLDVLDYGCGTGILAVLAAQKGAKQIDAIDYDENAVRNAQEIIDSNKAPQVKVDCGDKTYFDGRSYDILLANINKNVLKDSMQELQAAAKPGAKLLMSGILASDREEMFKLTENYGFRLKSQQEKGQWVLLVFAKEKK